MPDMVYSSRFHAHSLAFIIPKLKDKASIILTIIEFIKVKRSS